MMEGSPSEIMIWPMTTQDTAATRAVVQPLPENIRSAQPGGGVCRNLELAWGRWRRWWLRHFRPRYVRVMAQLRHGDTEGAPHEILDPRDLKYCRNQCTCSWSSADDPFRWRNRLPFTRWGAAELQVMGWPLLALTVVLWHVHWYSALVPAIVFGLIVFFFRDPPRRIPQDGDILVSPADGTIAEVSRLEHDEHIGGPAVKIGIFLSILMST
jgi:phosphatidylserine decarboxylase